MVCQSVGCSIGQNSLAGLSVGQTVHWPSFLVGESVDRWACPPVSQYDGWQIGELVGQWVCELVGGFVSSFALQSASGSIGR